MSKADCGDQKVLCGKNTDIHKAVEDRDTDPQSFQLDLALLTHGMGLRLLPFSPIRDKTKLYLWQFATITVAPDVTIRAGFCLQRRQLTR